MSDIEFIGGEPPARRFGTQDTSTRWRVVTEKLQADPGRWAIVDRTADINSASIAKVMQRLKARGCEALTRRVDGELRLYARWPEDAS